MRDLRRPFKFDFRELVKMWRRNLNTRIDGVSISWNAPGFPSNSSEVK